VQVPKLPKLDGWKGYDPKVTVNVDPGEPISGSKTIEYLLLPERAVPTRERREPHPRDVHDMRQVPAPVFSRTDDPETDRHSPSAVRPARQIRPLGGEILPRPSAATSGNP